MRGFLKSNGYADVFGKEDFDSSKTKYTWGYADEDLYEKAFKLIEESKDKPYFLTLLTMSSHEPFDYPKGIVAPYENAKLDGFANAIKYSDYAIGKFMQKLKSKGMLKNTVVAFIADHTNNTYNATSQPVTNNKIAALIVSDDFKGGQEYDKLASQIDFAPTILDIAGISQNIPTMGTSVLKNQRDSALLLTHDKTLVYLLPNKMIFYKDKHNYQTYDYNKTKLPNDDALIKDGLSYIYSSKYLYENSLYK
jgi:phosphoglycerol transferase MdoB-like AlkP superfamily enzyme